MPKASKFPRVGWSNLMEVINHLYERNSQVQQKINQKGDNVSQN